MHVVATAGHVDHGKSTLVRALTGGEPDRLDEERRRGLSIELGYCWTEIDPVGDVVFVDVPGHERFIATTLAGLGPAPTALLVVAADDPWMPQAAEHLAALDALRVDRGVLAVTRSDLADPAPALERARSQLARTSLAGAPSVVVSGRTGEGTDLLRRTLGDVLATEPDTAGAGDPLLWVDRRFHRKGVGTVVTGTLTSGVVSVGDVLDADGGPVRVRGLEALGRPRDRVRGVARVALALGGRVPDGIARGTALRAPGAFLDCVVVDVAVDGDEPLPKVPLLHLGTALVASRARLLGGRWWRLTLERALPLRTGARVLLRDPGSRRLWGAEVIDPVPPPLRRRGAAATRAEDLARWTAAGTSELSRRGLARRSVLRRACVPLDEPPPGAVVAGDWVLDVARVADCRRRLADLVTRAPDGVAAPEAARTLGLPSADLVDALVSPPLRVEGGRIRGADAPATAPEVARSLDALRADLDGNPFAAPDAHRLQELGLDEATVARLNRDGAVLRLAPGVVLLPDAADRAVVRLRELPSPFTAGEARRALETTRRVVLPLLAHLDATRRTVRLPDDRRRLVRG